MGGNGCFTHLWHRSRPRAGISGTLDVLNEWLVLRQEDFPGRSGDLPARLAKYEKRVTTDGEQDNIG